MFLLRSYSHHSLLSAVPKIPALVDDAIEKGYTTIALTDEDTSSSFVELYDYCQDKDIKPALGFTTRIPNISESEGGYLGKNKSFSKAALIAKNESGYKNILELISLSRTVNEKPNFHLNLSEIKKYLETKSDFFVVLCGIEHELIQNIERGQIKTAEKILDEYVNQIGAENLIVELAVDTFDQDPKETIEINKKLAKICESKNIKYVASPAPRYLSPEDEEVFRVVLAVRDGKRLAGISLNRDHSLPSKKELIEKYNYLPSSTETEDLESQINISIRTDYDKNVDGAFFPIFDLPEGQNAAGRLKWETYIGLVAKFQPSKTKLEWKEVFPYEKYNELVDYAVNLKPEVENLKGYTQEYFDNVNPIQNYINRMEYELDIIITKGYPDYFLVFGDLMSFCRENGIVINTRGSAAGALVGLLNSINILDPLLYIIPFERFLNPLRPSPPDIDGDFADDRRDEVIKYITEKYGSDQVCQIITFGTMLPRAAVRDVGRALGVSYNKCDKLSKIIPIAPQGRKTTFEWAMETSEELVQVYERDEEVKRIIDLAKKIEANYRHASSHAAGVIITPTKTTDYAAVQWDSEHKMVVCQFDMKRVEKMGLVKLDILGIRNLAILGNAVEITERRHNQKIDLLNIDINSRKTFDLLARGRTMGTFQLSGVAMTKYLVDLEPTKVQDLMAMVALYRPGPMGSIPDYIARKKNPELVEYLVPEMKKWMEASYGIFVYQEDLLLTAIELAGYDWGQADVLRKGMGKKIQAVIDQQHPIFVDGCVEHSGLPRETAEHIWSLMVPFGAYGFNKAHSSSYGMIAYWTAYMKAVYTVEFMTALMTAESSNLDKIAAAIEECNLLGIDVLPPDVNNSFDGFTIENDTTIRYGLSSVKNLGSDVIKFMIEEREKNGKFDSIESFLERMSPFQGFNKRSLEALIYAGCLDEIGGKTLTELGII